MQIRINSLLELHDWLDENHTQRESVWLEYKKKTKGGEFGMDEIIDELLCFGWIDSLPKKIDDTWTSIRVSPRNPKSNWSRVNKNKIVELEKQNRIQPSGYQSIKIAKQNGSWAALDDVENLILPKDLEKFLTDNNLLASWHEKPRSFKRGFLEIVLNSKRAETRTKRFTELAKTLAK